MNYGRCILLIFFLLTSKFVSSQVKVPYNNFTIKTLTTDQGLSQGSNYFQYEDSQGFVWITGNDALNRYDGKNIKIYNLRRQFINCKPLIQGYNFVEDEYADLYIGSINGLYQYHRKQDRFSLIHVFESSDEGVLPIAYFHDKVWCFNKLFQLATFDVKTGKIEYITKLNIEPIRSFHIYGAYQRTIFSCYPFQYIENYLFFATGNDIVCYNIFTKEQTFLIHSINRDSRFKISEWFYNSSDHLLDIWDGEHHYEFSLDTKKWSDKGDKIEKPLEIIFKSIENINRFNRPTNNDPDIKYDDSFIRRHAGRRSGIQLFDRSGNLSFAMESKGIAIVSFHPPLLNKKPCYSLRDQYNFKGGVQSFGELPNGDILFSSHIKFIPQTQIVTEVQNLRNVNADRFATDSIRKGLWYYIEYPTNPYPNVIMFRDAQANMKVVIKRDSNTNFRITDLSVLPDGRILCATSEGLKWLKPDLHKMVSVINTDLSSAFAISQLSDDRIAVSSIEHTMTILKTLATDTMKVLKQILPGIQSFYMQEDRERNRYWVGTNEGVYLLNDDFNVIHHFDNNNGLAGNNVYGLLLDNQMNVWCSHQHGLSSIDAETFHIINYDKEDGIQDWDFNNRSFYKASDGTLYFGGLSGFNYFKPPLSVTEFYKPEIYVDEITVNKHRYLPDTNANLIDYLGLKSDQNNLEFKVFVKDLESAPSRHILYRFSNGDTTWNTVDEKGQISLLNLSSGTYELEFALRNKLSLDLMKQKSILIDIAFPFYRRLWFWVLLFSVSLGVIWLLYNRWVKRKHAAAIDRLLDKQALSEFEIQALKAQMNPHFIFNCLNSIKGLIYEEELEKADLYLEKFSNLLRSTLKYSSRPSISIEAEIEYITTYLEMEKLRFKNKLEYVIQVDTTMSIDEVMIPSMLLQPIVENAIHHGVRNLKGSVGIITINVYLAADTLEITIDDNGIGRQKAAELKKNRKSIHESKGLQLTQRRLELYKIGLDVIDKKDENGLPSGTTIVLHIPIPLQANTT